METFLHILFLVVVYLTAGFLTVLLARWVDFPAQSQEDVYVSVVAFWFVLLPIIAVCAVAKLSGKVFGEK